MAVKSKKAPAKKTAAKKTQPNKPAAKKAAAKKPTARKPTAKKTTARSSKAKVVEMEVVPDVPDLMSPEVVKQIATVERMVGDMVGMPDSALLKAITTCAGQSAEFSRHAATAGASALVYAWGCGRLLNEAKEQLGHGAFGKWRNEHLVPTVMSERTSARYMQLAARCNDVRALLQWAPTLKQAYVECGILPDPSVSDREPGDKDEVLPKEKLFTSLTNLQKGLRLFETNLKSFEVSREKLDEHDRTQLQLMKEQIAEFSQRILTLLP